MLVETRRRPLALNKSPYFVWPERDRQESSTVHLSHNQSHSRGIGARMLLIYIDPVLTKQDS